MEQGEIPGADLEPNPDRRVYQRTEVFVVGGQPTVTYNPRPAQGVDQRVRDYLDERGRILCITGPTKSGKTVLIRGTIPNALRVSGGEIASVEDFWSDIVDGLAAYTDEQAETSRGTSEEATDSFGGAAKIGGSGIDGKHDEAARTEAGQRHTLSRTRDPRRVAKEELLKTKPPVVLDDFHHVGPEIQQAIVRGVKDLVFEGIPMIFVAVPHRAADVVRAEREMRGRVEHLEIPPWTIEELDEIAEKGFAALNIECPHETSRAMANESYGSPHLMQDFCLKICKGNRITQTLPARVRLEGAITDTFFRGIAATEGDDDVYQRLKQGPARSDRIERRLRGGELTDIYGAVLLAVASTGPKPELDWTEIATALRRVLADDAPQRQEYTRVLEKMAQIAKTLVWDDEHNRYVGDPALDYDARLGKLHISDPFFLFQMRWRVRPPNGNGSHIS